MNAKHDLAEALCQLLETKTLEKITVKDIVARCGVNRQTFYYHFRDVYDLMRWIFDREAAALTQSVRSNGSDWRQELHTITDVLRSKRHLVMNAYRSVNRRDLERYLHFAGPMGSRFSSMTVWKSPYSAARTASTWGRRTWSSCPDSMPGAC